MTGVKFNAKMRLFSLYVSKREVMKAIRLGNEVINEDLFTTDEMSGFAVESLFKSLNNSKKRRIMVKKL